MVWKVETGGGYPEHLDRRRSVQSGGVRSKPETHEAEIQAEDDVTKVRKDSADIMKESRSIRNWAPSRIFLVKMSLGLTAPGM